ncbi:putative phage abortive infection protein [Aestuariispira insulae]|uniref:Putative phage abortive infection protein n=1 Tax=Aestuariispira insulae TaxID=1461337 RepID=A0A3D9HVR8_9PROT|nr:putative phage abortive infection protein [Aestuariispira insulae]RED53481.1 putative phage abortive infection protein [Aestuariispira insulae]
MTITPNEVPRRSSLNVLVLVAVAFVLCLILGYAFALIFGERAWVFDDIGKAGLFGDSFGILNSLFSGLAFVGIVYTILLQKQELGYQREELALTRKELMLSREEMARQVEASQQQNFEATFFQMLRFHSDTIDSMQATYKHSKYLGRECIKVYRQYFDDVMHEKIPANAPSDIEVEELARFNQFWSYAMNDLLPYFKQFQKILSFIENSDVAGKQLYADLVSSKLSAQEAGLIEGVLSYNNSFPELSSLVEKYEVVPLGISSKLKSEAPTSISVRRVDGV